MIKDFTLSRCSLAEPTDDFQSCKYYDNAEKPTDCGYCKKPDYFRCIASNLPIPISHSSLQDFLTCHQLYYLKVIRGIQIKPEAISTPMKLGSLWDSLLQKQMRVDVDIPELIDRLQIDSRSVAKIKGLYKAYKELEVIIDKNGIPQYRIDKIINIEQRWLDDYPTTIHLTGYYDRKYLDYFVESKLSGRPDNYLDPFFIQSQVGTYFLADPGLEHCVMEITRTPDLKSTGSHKDEDDETYSNRVYSDVLSRPSYYFIGWNTKTHTYGRKFYRSEFNLDHIAARLSHVLREIHEAKLFNGWYMNDRVCNNVLPGISCDFKPICKTGNMADNLFEVKAKPVVF